MAGGIQEGIVATSKESKKSEKIHTSWVAEVIESYGPDWTLTKDLSISEVLETKGMVNEYALDKKGRSQKWNADGGFIWYKGQVKGVAENKYQKNRPNACERAGRYFMMVCGGLFEAKGIFVSTAGPGFEKILGGGATGPTIEMLRFSGATVLENADEITFKKALSKMLDSLV